jgi:hypothetical protein
MWQFLVRGDAFIFKFGRTCGEGTELECNGGIKFRLRVEREEADGGGVEVGGC